MIPRGGRANGVINLKSYFRSSGREILRLSGGSSLARLRSAKEFAGNAKSSLTRARRAPPERAAASAVPPPAPPPLTSRSRRPSGGFIAHSN